MELHLARPALLADVTSPEAVLRCVQEEYDERGKPKDNNEPAVVIARELWSTTRAAEFQRGEFVWRFKLPPGLPTTALSEYPPRYWELELKVARPGVDYAATFLVPVYAGRRR